MSRTRKWWSLDVRPIDLAPDHGQSPGADLTCTRQYPELASRADKAPYLAALVASSWMAMPSTTAGPGSRFTSGPSRSNSSRIARVRLKLNSDDLLEACPFPQRLIEKVVGTRERQQAALEALLGGLR